MRLEAPGPLQEDKVVTIPPRSGIFDIADLLARPDMQHVVITGRGAPPELIEIADTVTEMNVVKHAFKAGIAAQAGTEW